MDLVNFIKTVIVCLLIIWFFGKKDILSKLAFIVMVASVIFVNFESLLKIVSG